MGKQFYAKCKNSAERKMKRKTIAIILIIILSFIQWGSLHAQIRILTIGDSTMAEYDEEKRSGEKEMRGWVQMLPAFLSDDVALRNAAKNGRSSKTFYNEYWATGLRGTLVPGEYVFIQFGHNDEKADGKDTEGIGLDKRGTAAWGQYQEYLYKYITETRQKGAIPILFTPIVRCLIDTITNSISDIGMHNLTHLSSNATMNNYPEAMRALAIEMDVPLVDMTLLTKKEVEACGADKAREIIYAKNDNTHLCAKGGIKFASLAVKELKRQHILAEYLHDTEELTGKNKASKLNKKETINIPIENFRKIKIKWSPTNSEIKTKGYSIETVAKGLDIITKEGKTLMTIKGGRWPSGDIDMDASRYMEFRLTAKNEMYLDEIQINITSVNTQEMFITAIASTDKNFQEAYNIATMEKLQEGKAVVSQYPSKIKIEKGKSFKIRIYPWMQIAASDKYLQMNTIQLSCLVQK